MEPGVRTKLDYSDYLVTPDDGLRYEILDGNLCVTAAPAPLHQQVSWHLEHLLGAYFHGRGLGQLYHAPIGVILTEHDIVEPDIVVVGNPAQISQRGIEGAPLLVVEILSPSTRKRDRSIKSQRYCELGVEHCWLVDPDERRIECLRSEGGTYRQVATAAGDAAIEHPDWPGLVIDGAELWRWPPAR